MIDPTAQVHPSVKLGKGVDIGAYSVIGPNVTIGDNTIIANHCSIKGKTRIGAANQFYPFCSIGDDSQDLKFEGEDAILEIGDHNVFREFVTVHRGTSGGGGVTKVGDHNLIMNYGHIAHDCQVGNHVVMSNNATLAGHVIVGDHVTFGGFSAVHQFVQIGSYAFIGAKSAVYMDVMPYVTVAGLRAKVYGLNKIGLRRKGFSRADIALIDDAYRKTFRTTLNKKEIMEALAPLAAKSEHIALMVDMITNSTRGIARESREKISD